MLLIFVLYGVMVSGLYINWANRSIPDNNEPIWCYIKTVESRHEVEAGQVSRHTRSGYDVFEKCR